jgi:hypothetical protein
VPPEAQGSLSEKPREACPGEHEPDVTSPARARPMADPIVIGALTSMATELPDVMQMEELPGLQTTDFLNEFCSSELQR